jgi:hypothetical protein
MSRVASRDAIQCSPSAPPAPRTRAEPPPVNVTSRWRFASPSLLLLALLTLPFPWIEVRCGGLSPRVYRQTGVEVLLDRQTDIDSDTGAATSR